MSSSQSAWNGRGVCKARVHVVSIFLSKLSTKQNLKKVHWKKSIINCERYTAFHSPLRITVCPRHLSQHQMRSMKLRKTFKNSETKSSKIYETVPCNTHHTKVLSLNWNIYIFWSAVTAIFQNLRQTFFQPLPESVKKRFLRGYKRLKVLNLMLWTVSDVDARLTSQQAHCCVQLHSVVGV